MKDRVFSGSDVEQALAAAAAALGLPVAELRYVVLEKGLAGGHGLKPTPARVAVLIEEGPTSGLLRPDRGRLRPEQDRPVEDAADAKTRLRALVRAVAEAGGLELESEIEETSDTLVLNLRGPDCPFFFGEDDRGEPLLALEHLLQRACGPALAPLELRVRCEGFRARRDEALAREARRLAADVRADGAARQMSPLNAYERRIVHLALQAEPGVTTYSVGEGRGRRVTVAPKSEPPGDAGPVESEEDNVR